MLLLLLLESGLARADDTGGKKNSGREAGRGDFAILPSSCSRFRADLDGRERFLFLSFSQEGSPREFFSLFYLVCTRLSVLALGSPRRSHGSRARPATFWTRVISSAIPCPSRGNASAIRNISEQRRGERTTLVRLDSRHRMWLSVALSMAGRCRVQMHRLFVRMHNKNRCNSMLHQVKYILLFVLSYFMSWTLSVLMTCALCSRGKYDWVQWRISDEKLVGGNWDISENCEFTCI